MLKAPKMSNLNSTRNPEITAKVSTMLGKIESDGLGAVPTYARDLYG